MNPWKCENAGSPLWDLSLLTVKISSVILSLVSPKLFLLAKSYLGILGRHWDAGKTFLVGKLSLREVFSVSKLGLATHKKFPYLCP